MPLMERRYVQLTIAPPKTLEDAIRGVIGPVEGSGASVTFTVPEWVEIGDAIEVYTLNKTFVSTVRASTGPNVLEPVTGWDRYWYASDYVEDISPYPTLTVEFPGTTWIGYRHYVESGDAGTSITLDFTRYDFWSASYVPITFGAPSLCGVVWKGGWGNYDANYGGVAFDYEYDDAVGITHGEPYSVMLYYNGLYGGGTSIKPIGATTLCEFSGNTSFWLGAKMVYGGGPSDYHIVPGIYGIWMAQNLVP